MKNRDGFTLLELLAVLGILAVLSLFGLPAFQDWNAKRSFDKAMNDVYSLLSNAKILSLQKSTTTKITTSRSTDNYTITIYHNSSAITNCSTSTDWTIAETSTIRINSNFEITGSGIGNVCFFKDGTSSSGTYNIVQKNGLTDLGNGSISVILTTGFIDVVKN